MDVKPLIGLAGVLAATMTVDLNSQVTALALPDIQGGLSLGSDQGTWLGSLYTAGEAMGMAVAPWLAVTFSPRRFILFAVFLCAITSTLIPFAPNLALLYPLRGLQGLSEGFTVPLLMATALRALDPPIRLYGLAAYALTATFFPQLSPTVAALWVDVLDWRWAFFQAIPLCAIAAVLVWYGMPQDEPQYDRLKLFDWPGTLSLFAGVVALTVILTQGDRLNWFDSPWISGLALVAAASLPLFAMFEWNHPLPLMKLQLLGRPNLAFGVTGLLLFLLISLAFSQLPLVFLEQVQGFRPLQAHGVTLVVALAQLVMLPVMAVVLDKPWVDARIVAGVGLVLVLLGQLGDTYVTPNWQAEQFMLWQLPAAVGAPMVVMALLMLATNSLDPSEGPFASPLVNAPRAVAEATGVWLIQLLTRWRGALHSDRLLDRLGLEPERLRYAGPDLAQMVRRQVTVLTLADAFWITAGVTLAMMAALLILGRRSLPPRIELAKS